MRRISVASNAIQTIDTETAYLIICCLNCIRRDGNSTYKTGLKHIVKLFKLFGWCGSSSLNKLRVYCNKSRMTS